MSFNRNIVWKLKNKAAHFLVFNINYQVALMSFSFQNQLIDEVFGLYHFSEAEKAILKKKNS